MTEGAIINNNMRLKKRGNCGHSHGSEADSSQTVVQEDIDVKINYGKEPFLTSNRAKPKLALI